MSRQDLYPSRIGSEVAVLPRKDPVIHGGHHPGDALCLSDHDLDRFERDGALVLDSILPRPFLESLADRAEALRSTARSDAAEVIREPDSEIIRSIFAVHQSDPAFRAIADDPLIVGIAERILGGPVYVHQSRINFKPAFNGREFYWHSDFETWHVEDGMPRMRACSLSINLTENRSSNGPLMYIPGSHHHFVSCVGETPADHYKQSLRRQEVGVPPAHVLERFARDRGVSCPTGPAGSAVLFDCNLMHGSNGNITPFPRTNLFLVFNRVDNALEAPFSGGEPRPEFVAHRSQRETG